jgi:NTE family protein
LEEERLTIEGISGTSAGAMNAALLVNGYIRGGRDGAKKELRVFWERMAEVNALSPLHQHYAERFVDGWNLDSLPSYMLVDVLSRFASPYFLNPLNINPVQWVLEEMLDIPALQNGAPIKLFVATTHVESGQSRVFSSEELTVDALLASACLPFLFQAVEIDGEHYWDGGYMGNPVIWPLIYDCVSEDVLLVQLNPIHRDGLPTKSYDIINRLNEISFNSSLISEMRAIQFVQRLVREGKLDSKQYKDMRIHLVYSPEQMKALNASSKMNVDWDFLRHLFGLGREAADGWLRENWTHIGERGTVDIQEKFMCGPPRKHSHVRATTKQPAPTAVQKGRSRPRKG